MSYKTTNPLRSKIKQTLYNRARPAMFRGRINSLKMTPVVRSVRRKAMYDALKKNRINGI